MRVIISGASRGIGRALVEEYVASKDEVFAICREPTSAHDLRELQRAHQNLTILQGDVTNPASIADIKSSIGGKPVDVLLNVAGTIHLEITPEDIDFAKWTSAFDVMTIGPIRMTMALLPNLEAASGKVISISSQVGASGWASGGFYSYGAAKAALNRAMKSLAVDLQTRGVTVAVVHPGHVQTDMGGPDGELTPQESARGTRSVVDRLDLTATGQFLNWNGTTHAW